MPPCEENAISSSSEEKTRPGEVSASYLGVFRAQLVEDVGGVEAGVVAQLPGNDLQGFGVRSDEQLLLPGNGPGVIPQVL